MKLLMISGDRSLTLGKRGAFWYTLELLRTHFARIDIICPRTAAGLPVTRPFPNVYLHPSPRSLLFQPSWIVRKGKELLAAHGHEAMTVHEYPPFYNGIGAWLLSRATGVPYALEIHHIVGSPIASSFSEWIGRFLSRLFLPLEAKGAARIRTVNNAVRNTLVSWGVPGGKIDVVSSLYIDASVLKPEWHRPKEYDVAFCARLVANKGLPDLLRALRGVPSATLLVIGDGPRRARYERLAKRWLGGRVTFAGWLPSHAAVAEALRSARIFVMNSRSEGGPRVALEAMACGVPVIATHVGVMPEVIETGRNGVLVSRGIPALRSAIKTLLGDAPLRGRMAHEAAAIIGSCERSAAIAGYARFLQSIPPFAS